MNEVALRAGQSTFDTSGGELGFGAPVHRMSRIPLEAIRSRRIVVEQNVARKVGGGNPDDFDFISHRKKVIVSIRKPSCNAYWYRLASQSTLALHSSSCACPLCRAPFIVFVSQLCETDD
jgi:hypothetical protein